MTSSHQERALPAVARGEKVGEFFQRLGARRFHAHAGSETAPVQRRIFEVEEIERGPARIGADLGQFVFQDGISPVERITVVTSRFSRACVQRAWIV